MGDATGIGTIRNDDGQATTTTITSHNPDPSFVGQAYSVRATVLGQSQSPTGSVTVSDGEESCSFSLSPAISPNANGLCALISLTPGPKTLTASYTPSSSSFAASSGTATHQVNVDDVIFRDSFE